MKCALGCVIFSLHLAEPLPKKYTGCFSRNSKYEFLEKHPAVESVNYPGLKSNPYHELGCKYLRHGFGGVLTFRVKGGFEAAAALVTRLELILHVGSVGDAKSLIVHPASTTHSQLSPQEQVAAGVYPNMLRLSVGIENIDDLIADLAAAL